MNSKGQTAVEFALEALVLLTLLFAFSGFAVMFYVNLAMQHAVRQGARCVVTGQAGLVGRRAALVQKIKESSNGLYEKTPPRNNQWSGSHSK